MGTRRPTQKEIAAAIGLADTKSVRDHHKNGMPINSIPAAKEWFDHNVRGNGNNGANGHGDISAYGRKLLAEAQCKEADAMRKRLDLRERVGELVDRVVVKRWVMKNFARVRARLESIPDELSGSLPPEVRSQVAADLREWIRLVLIELGSWENCEDEIDDT